MSRPRFLADHDLKEKIIQGVFRREPAIEFVRARDVGVDRLPDDKVLAFAARESLLVVSHDVSTMPAAAQARMSAGQPMSGLFLVAQSKRLAPIIDELILVWAASTAEEWANRVEYLPL